MKPSDVKNMSPEEVRAAVAEAALAVKNHLVARKLGLKK